MPGYKTHITASSLCGVALGGISFIFGNVGIAASIYGGSLCAIGGLVPDIDSKSSTSFRHCLGIVAGFSSLLLVSRLRDYLFDPQTVALIGGGNFIFTWILLGWIIQKCTVHRGMCHSIPMAILTGEIAFLLSSGGVNERLYCGAAALIGVLVHLFLDEFYSFQVKNGTLKIKKSLGSALKLMNFDDKKGTFFMLALVGAATFVTVHEPVWNEIKIKQANEEETAERVKQFGGEDLRLIQKENPSLFDIAAVEWAVRNDLIISPRTEDNLKWQQLQSLLSDTDSDSSKSNISIIDLFHNNRNSEYQNGENSGSDHSWDPYGNR